MVENISADGRADCEMGGERHAMTWTAYHINPIDFGWEFLPTFEEVAAKFAASDARRLVHSELYEGDMLPDLREALTQAKALAKQVYWEGDFRTGTEPHILFLPDEGDFSYAFVWKQDNNGSTFVISPHPLPWLDRISCL